MSSDSSAVLKVPSEVISKIDDDLDSLDELLEPLLASPLTDTLDKLSDIHRAKLCTLLPYVVHSLMLIYLKTNGVDPKSHPVMNEMKRVKSYMKKISEAEGSKQGHAKVDTEVASRFIKSAIASATAHNQATTSKTIGVIGNHLRFDVRGQTMTNEAAAKIRARNEVDDEEEEDSSEEADLTVVGGALEDNNPPDTSQEKEGGEKKSTKSTPELEKEESTSVSLLRMQRKRPRIDPFAGYDNESAVSTSGQVTPADTEGSEAGNSGMSSGSKPKRRRRRKGKQVKSKLRDEGQED